MTLLVVGASGQLGAELCRRAPEAGWQVIGAYYRAPVDAEHVDWRRVDLRDPAAIRELVTSVRPTAVINAAYRADDWTVTAEAAARLAQATVEVGARLVHISSDVVHGGRPQAYRDDAAPTPVSPYGAAKAAAETAVRVLDAGAALVRTSIIVGDDERSRQVKMALDLLAGRAPGVLFTDEVRCPIAVGDLAAAVLELVDSRFAGLINVAGSDAVSRAELGRLIALRYGHDPGKLPTGTSAEAGLGPRPGVVRLDNSLAERLLRTRLRGVREVLAAEGDRTAV